MTTVILFHDDKFRCSFGKKLNSMRKTGQLCDCILKCGEGAGLEFKVHLIVLASSSPFLRKKIDAEFPGLIQDCNKKVDLKKAELQKAELERAPVRSQDEQILDDLENNNCFKFCCMFHPKQNNMIENEPRESQKTQEAQITQEIEEPSDNRDDKMTHIMKFQGLDCTIMDDILTYLYTGRMEIDVNKITNVWKEAKYFQLDNLEEFCLKTLSVSINKDNCFDVWQLSNNLETDLENQVVACIYRNVEYILENPTALDQISAANLSRLIHQSPLLSHMEAKYKLVEKWAMVDFDKRLCDFEELIKDFEFNHFNENFLKKVVLNNETLKTSNVFLRKILEGLPVISSTKTLTSTGSHKMEKRFIHTGSELYEMSNDYANLLTMRRIKWKNKFFGQTVLEKTKIFMCGGENRTEASTRSCSVYNYGPNTYENLNDMKYDRALNSCIYSTRHKRVFVVGGETMPIEIYDPYKNEWIDGPEYSCKSGYYTYLAEIHGDIYAACWNSISRYDFRINKWDYYQCYGDNTWFRSILVTGENSFYAFEDNRVREFDIRFKKFIPNSEFRIEKVSENEKHWLRDVAKIDNNIILLFNCGQIRSLKLSDSKKELTEIGQFPHSFSDCRPYLTSLKI